MYPSSTILCLSIYLFIYFGGIFVEQIASLSFSDKYICKRQQNNHRFHNFSLLAGGPGGGGLSRQRLRAGGASCQRSSNRQGAISLAGVIREWVIVGRGGGMAKPRSIMGEG